MVELSKMPIQAFYCRAQNVSEIDPSQRLYAIKEERESVPIQAEVDSLVYFFLGIGILISFLLCIGLVMIYLFYRKETSNGFIRHHLKHLDKKSGESSGFREEDSEALLYRRLCELMETEKLFKNSQLNREILAERLGTNHVYLAKAVRKYTEGLTVGEFINEVRLQHSASLLVNNLDLSIDEVKQMSGFNSRATFGRLFRERYRMSPSKYRENAREKGGESLHRGKR